MKQGTLKKIAQFLNSIIETAEGIYKKLLKKEEKIIRKLYKDIMNKNKIKKI